MSNQIPNDRFYTENHEWVKLNGPLATVGITDFAQSSLGDIVFLELPEVGSDIEALASFGVVESIKSVSDLYSPVSGKILEVNSSLIDSPELCNEAPYESWLIKIRMPINAKPDLMSAKEYENFIQQSS